METMHLVLQPACIDGFRSRGGDVFFHKKHSLLQYAIRCCRRHKLISERITLLPFQDQLQVVQLCIASQNKKKGELFEANREEVVEQTNWINCEKAVSLLETVMNSTLDTTVHQHTRSLYEDLLEKYTSFMKSSNHFDAVDIFKTFLTELLKTDSALFKDVSSVHFEFHGVAPDLLQEVVAEMLKKTTIHQEQQQIGLLSSAKALLFSFMPSQEQGDNASDRLESSDRGFLKEIVAQIICSYIHLLVNTRSELALACIFNTPERGLDSHAFTHLKHEAREKNMSLFQMTLSLMAQLRLGGQGYAPSPDSNLLLHVKGLGMLTDFISRLQTRMEDPACTRSGLTRVIVTIKNSLANCKSKRFPHQVVEEVANLIERQLDDLVLTMEDQGLLISPDKVAANKGGTLASRRAQRVLLWFLDKCASAPTTVSSAYLWMQDLSFGSHTPTRFSCMLTRFCSPVLTKDSSPLKKAGSKKPGLQKKNTNIISQAPDGQESKTLQEVCFKRWLDSVIVLPSKTVMHPAESIIKEYTKNCLDKQANCINDSMADNKENKQSRPSPAEKQVCKKICHRISSVSSKEAPIGTISLVVGNHDNQKQKCFQQNKKCRRRLLPQIKGQQQITHFFRL